MHDASIDELALEDANELLKMLDLELMHTFHMLNKYSYRLKSLSVLDDTSYKTLVGVRLFGKWSFEYNYFNSPADFMRLLLNENGIVEFCFVCDCTIRENPWRKNTFEEICIERDLMDI